MGPCFDLSYLGLARSTILRSKHYPEMGLVKKASQLWQGARRHKKDSRGSKDDIEIGVKVAPKGKVAKFLAEKKLRLQKANRDTAEEESAEDKERTLMTRGVLSIHDLNDHMMEDSHKLRVIAKEQRIHIVEDDDEEDKTDESDEGESEDEVDESVIEDMRKLEENFKGISLKYRLLNRIGEGSTIPSLLTKHLI